MKIRFYMGLSKVAMALWQNSRVFAEWSVAKLKEAIEQDK